MLIQLISNFISGKGLYLDAMLVKEVLEELGHKVVTCDYTEPSRAVPAHINIFFEIMPTPFFKLSPQNWLFPNPEYCGVEPMKNIGKFQKIFCKTRIAYDTFTEFFKDRAESPEIVYTGFFSQIPNTPKPRFDRTSFLHIAGDNCFRGTDNLIKSWREFDIEYPLTIISHMKVHHNAKHPAITVYDKVSLDYMNHLRSDNLFHIQPSESEGWGHVLWESRAMGAIVITTDAPPMNEFSDELGIAGIFTLGAAAAYKRDLADMWSVSPEEIYNMVNFIGRLQAHRHIEHIQNRGMELARQFRPKFIENIRGVLDKYNIRS